MKPPSGVIGEDGVEIQRVAVAAVDAAEPAAPDAGDARQSARVRIRLVAGFEGAGVCGRRSSGGEQLVGGEALYAGAGRRAEGDSGAGRGAGPLHGMQIAVPRWSPDGKAIAFIGGLMSDQGVDGRRCVDCLRGGGGRCAI